jgi:hypothetical protein
VCEQLEQALAAGLKSLEIELLTDSMSTIPPPPADSGSSVKDSSVKDSSVRDAAGSSVRESNGTMYRISLEAGSSSEYQQTNLVTGFVRPGMLTDAHGCS